MGDESDLPRIVVEGDSILVFEENDWAAKDMKVDDEEESEDEEEKKEKKKGLDIENLVLHEEGLKGVLEEAVGGFFANSKSENAERNENFYELSGRELYKSELYDTGKEEVNPEADVRVLPGVDVDEFSKIKDRTALEKSGFIDFEADEARSEFEKNKDVYGLR